MKSIIKILAINFLLIAFFIGCNSSITDNNSNQVFSKISIEKLIDSLDVKTEDISILIDKSNFTLSVLNKAEKLKSYPVVLGWNPTRDKFEEGDGCTPEGTFHIVDKYPHNKWTKFIWLDYPTNDSREKFEKRKKQGLIKKGNTIGSEVGIHGVPTGRDDLIKNKKNWTAGCISLTTKDINEIYPFITKNTAIKIER